MFQILLALLMPQLFLGICVNPPYKAFMIYRYPQYFSNPAAEDFSLIISSFPSALFVEWDRDNKVWFPSHYRMTIITDQLLCKTDTKSSLVMIFELIDVLTGSL